MNRKRPHEDDSQGVELHNCKILKGGTGLSVNGQFEVAPNDTVKCGENSVNDGKDNSETAPQQPSLPVNASVNETQHEEEAEDEQQQQLGNAIIAENNRRLKAVEDELSILQSNYTELKDKFNNKEDIGDQLGVVGDNIGTLLKIVSSSQETLSANQIESQIDILTALLRKRIVWI